MIMGNAEAITTALLTPIHQLRPYRYGRWAPGAIALLHYYASGVGRQSEVESGSLGHGRHGPNLTAVFHAFSFCSERGLTQNKMNENSHFLKR
jgi:hypothetical protein